MYKKCSIVIIDDETDILAAYRAILVYKGYEKITLVSDSREALKTIEEVKPDIVLLDLSMPNKSGQELLQEIGALWSDLPIVVVSGINQIEEAVNCIKNGAFDYITKPVDSEKLVTVIEKALEQYSKSDLSSDTTITNPEYFNHIKTDSLKIKALFNYIESVAKSQMPVLIAGESGVGKELFAKAVYNASESEGDFVPVNVAGLDDTLFTDTLFGHLKGAYTGATTTRDGLIKKAENGVLFLDEIGDLGQASQLKLLRLLQEREYTPVGSDEKFYSNAKVVAATNVNLEEKVKEGTFRSDLYYRLKTHTISVPPLRERREDLPVLVPHFVQEAAKQLGKKAPFIPKEIYTVLDLIPFNGNIRELRSLIIDTMAQHQQGIVLSIAPVKEYLEKQSGAVEETMENDPNQPINIDGRTFPKLKDVEDFLLQEAMKKAKNNQTVAAKLLGVSQSKISRKLSSK